MWPSILILMGEVITKDGGISADYTFTILISALGSLITFVIGFQFHNINSTLKALNKNFSEFKDEFHAFVNAESVRNENYKIRIEQLEKKVK